MTSMEFPQNLNLMIRHLQNVTLALRLANINCKPQDMLSFVLKCRNNDRTIFGGRDAIFYPHFGEGHFK